jgi:AcrR family transcriptional regulator
MLFAAAERTVQEHGPDALSVRGVASDVGTTTRAVYSLFESKAGLIAALAVHGFDILRDGVAGVPVTSAPESDLVEAGLVFRRFAIEHPSLFRIAFQTNPSPLRSTPSVRSAANDALDVLTSRIRRLDDAGLLGGYSVNEATLHFHAVCEGLAGLELRGTFPSDVAGHLWRQGLTALVRGLAGREPSQRRSQKRAENPQPRPTRHGSTRTKPA